MLKRLRGDRPVIPVLPVEVGLGEGLGFLGENCSAQGEFSLEDRLVEIELGAARLLGAVLELGGQAAALEIGAL